MITAAHCAVSATKFKISLGAQTFHNQLESGRVIDVTTKKIIHPQYRDFLPIHDLSLIKLSRKIDFTDRIQPVLLPKSNDLFVTQGVIASGWGLKYTNDEDVASGKINSKFFLHKNSLNENNILIFKNCNGPLCTSFQIANVFDLTIRSLYVTQSFVHKVITKRVFVTAIQADRLCFKVIIAP